MDIDNILNNYLRMTGIINKVFRPKKTIIQLYNTLALPTLLYGSENLTIKARDSRRITAAEMKYMRRTAGYIWTDHKTNTEVAKELNITPVLDKIQDYKRNWIQHVNRMPRNRLPRLKKNTKPKKAEGTKEYLSRDFWTREIGTGQQVAQIFDCYIMMT
jgi:hypothetical protein